MLFSSRVAFGFCLFSMGKFVFSFLTVFQLLELV